MAWVGWDLNDQQVSILCCWTGLPPASFLQQLCRQGVLQMPFCCTFRLDLIQPTVRRKYSLFSYTGCCYLCLDVSMTAPFLVSLYSLTIKKSWNFSLWKQVYKQGFVPICTLFVFFFSFSFFFPQFLSVWFYKLGHFSGKDKFSPLEMYGLLPFGLSYCEKTKQNTTIKVFIQWLQAALERSKASGLQLNKQNIYSVPLD